MSRQSKYKLLALAILLIAMASFPQKIQSNVQTTAIPDFDCYRDARSVDQRALQLQTEFPDLVEQNLIGVSFENRPIYAVKLSRKNSQENKPRLVLISGLRANSFAPVEINLRFLEFILSSDGSNPTATWLLDFTEIYSVLIANPDGRLTAESQAQDGEEIIWENNTNPYCANAPTGVRLTLNFPYAWAAGTHDPCDPNYPGPQAASEPETQAITGFLSSLSQSSQPILLLHLDSARNFLMTPYLHDPGAPNPLESELYALANKLAYDTPAVPIKGPGTGNPGIYGTLLDFAFGELGVPSLTYKMGAAQAGGHTTACWYFEEKLLEPSLQALTRAAAMSAQPYEFAFGPEIRLESVSSHLNYLRLDGFADDYSFYKEHVSDYTSVERLSWSLDLPPWHPQAELQNFYGLQPIEAYPFRSTFSMILPYADIAPGKHLLFLQAWDKAAAAPSRPGLVTSVFITIPNLNYLPLMIK